MAVQIDKTKWVYAKEAAAILGTGIHGVAKLAERGTIRVVAVPGLRPRYAVEDCEKLVSGAMGSGSNVPFGQNGDHSS